MTSEDGLFNVIMCPNFTLFPRPQRCHEFEKYYFKQEEKIIMLMGAIIGAAVGIIYAIVQVAKKDKK